MCVTSGSADALYDLRQVRPYAVDDLDRVLGGAVLMAR